MAASGPQVVFAAPERLNRRRHGDNLRRREEPVTDKKLSFKEMCEKFEVTPRTLRYYEYIELLRPEKDGRARWYGSRETARMTLILRGRRWGFSLEEIRQWLEAYEKKGTEKQMVEFVRMADRQLEALESELEALKNTIAELRDQRDKVAGGHY